MGNICYYSSLVYILNKWSYGIDEADLLAMTGCMKYDFRIQDKNSKEIYFTINEDKKSMGCLQKALRRVGISWKHGNEKDLEEFLLSEDIRNRFYIVFLDTYEIPVLPEFKKIHSGRSMVIKGRSGDVVECFDGFHEKECLIPINMFKKALDISYMSTLDRNIWEIENGQNNFQKEKGINCFTHFTIDSSGISKFEKYIINEYLKSNIQIVDCTKLIKQIFTIRNYCQLYCIMQKKTGKDEKGILSQGDLILREWNIIQNIIIKFSLLKDKRCLGGLADRCEKIISLIRTENEILRLKNFPVEEK